MTTPVPPGTPTRTARPPGPEFGPTTVLRQLALLVRPLVGRTRPTTEVFSRVAATWGDLVHLRVGREHVYLASNPDLVRDVLVTHGRITHKGRGLESVRMLLGNGLLTAEDDEHLRNRRLVSPAFNHAHVAEYAEAMTRIARATDGSWTDGAQVDMSVEMAAVTLRIAGATLFGRDLDDEVGRVGAALGAAMALFERFQMPGAHALLTLPTPWRAEFRRARDELYAVVSELVTAHRADPDRYEGDVLSVLLSSRDADGSRLSDEQVRDEVLTLLLAGHETTAVLLTWAWYLLDRTPAAAALLHAEVDALTGAPGPGDAFGGGLPVTRAVVAEAMRLYPPAWTVGRRYTAPAVLRLGGTDGDDGPAREHDGTVRGHDLHVDVPPRTIAVTSQWVLHRDPRWWGPDAAEFRPQRWLKDGAFDETAPGHPRWAYFPFGGGRRVCLGEHFAWTEAVLVLATLSRHWQPQTVGGREIGVRTAVTLRPAGGMPMTLRRRHPVDDPRG